MALEALATILQAVSVILKCILDYLTKFRETMSQTNRDKMDAVYISTLERWERWASAVDKLIAPSSTPNQ